MNKLRNTDFYDKNYFVRCRYSTVLTNSEVEVLKINKVLQPKVYEKHIKNIRIYYISNFELLVTPLGIVICMYSIL